MRNVEEQNKFEKSIDRKKHKLKAQFCQCFVTRILPFIVACGSLYSHVLHGLIGRRQILLGYDFQYCHQDAERTAVLSISGIPTNTNESKYDTSQNKSFLKWSRFKIQFKIMHVFRKDISLGTTYVLFYYALRTRKYQCPLESCWYHPIV